MTDTLFLDRQRGAIAYDTSGTGPLVVCVPGMGDLRSTYRFLAPALAAAGCQVVTTDLRGHGDSDTSFREYGGEATAGDIIALVEHLGQPAVVVGNSMAAGSAVLAAAERPELVRGLVLLGPFVRNPPNTNPVMAALFRVAMAPLWAARVWKAYLPTLYTGRKPDDFDEYRRSVVAALSRPGYAKAFSATTRTSHAAAEAALARVAAPSLVVMGELDPDFSRPANEAEWISEQLASKVVMVAESGHYPQSQRPDVVTREITAFVKSLAPIA